MTLKVQRGIGTKKESKLLRPRALALVKINGTDDLCLKAICRLLVFFFLSVINAYSKLLKYGPSPFQNDLGPQDQFRVENVLK